MSNGFFNVLFADDTTLDLNIEKNINVDPIREEMIETASDWVNANYLCLNRDKTQYLEFSLKSKASDTVKFLCLALIRN